MKPVLIFSMVPTSVLNDLARIMLLIPVPKTDGRTVTALALALPNAAMAVAGN